MSQKVRSAHDNIICNHTDVCITGIDVFVASGPPTEFQATRSRLKALVS